MSEINNKINNIGYPKSNFDKNIGDIKKLPQDKSREEKSQPEGIRDTGVLGRSQVLKGSDISKSVDEAVALAQEYPEILLAGDGMFDALYDDFIKAGNTPEEAYAMASAGMMEFREIATPHCSKN